MVEKGTFRAIGTIEAIMITFVALTVMYMFDKGFPKEWRWPLLLSSLFYIGIYIALYKRSVGGMAQLGILAGGFLIAYSLYKSPNIFPFTLAPLAPLDWTGSTIVSVDITTQQVFWILALGLGIMIGIYYKRWKEGIIEAVWEELQRL